MTNESSLHELYEDALREIVRLVEENTQLKAEIINRNRAELAYHSEDPDW